MYPFVIIGAGSIGAKRAKAIQTLGGTIVGVCDLNRERAEGLAHVVGARAFTELSTLFEEAKPEAAVVATSNDVLAQISIKALENGCHVLVEKPAARSVAELREVYSIAEQSNKIVCVGFNHRFHPALLKAKQLCNEGALGELFLFRACYGHGGRIGYEKEWRANPEISGGGELIDQGVHLVDLVQWFGGDFQLEFGRAETFFWKMPVDDNSFLFLRSIENPKRVAWLHASCTEWKNTFHFEIFGNKGKLEISGLGRSYGKENLRFYKVKPEMGVPEETIFEFPEEDLSWQKEIEAFCVKCRGDKSEVASIEQAMKTLQIVQVVYSRGS